MGIQIHKMSKPDGSVVYRLWSSGSDTYTTDELNEEELRDQLLLNQLYQAISHIRGRGVEQSLHLASNMEEWEKENEENEENEDNKSYEPDSDNDIMNEIRLDYELAEVALKAVKAKLAELDSQ